MALKIFSPWEESCRPAQQLMCRRAFPVQHKLNAELDAQLFIPLLVLPSIFMVARTQEYIFQSNKFAIGLSKGALPGLREGLARDEG